MEFTQGATKYCMHCGAVIPIDAVVCTNCGRQVANLQQGANTVYVTTPVYTRAGRGPYNKWVAFLLCFFLGFLGVHKFYEEKIGLGILYILTAGLFGIGWFVDWIVILCHPEHYYIY